MRTARRLPSFSSPSGRRSVAAILVFFAFTAPFGIAAHLLSELFGLGWHDDADVVLSARHGYLAALALLSLGGLLAALLALPRGDRRSRIAALVDALPFRGRGLGFTACAFVAQFAFFAVTQIGEGCPLCGGDVFTGVLAAAIAAALGAFAVALGKRRILEFAFALICAIATAALTGPAASAATAYRGPAAASPRRSPFAFRYRPPPIAA
jgi:hypothetical protein